MTKSQGHCKKPKPGDLQSRKWERFLRGPDPTLLENLYVPGLQEAISYDRCCSYFSSSVLAAAARGYGSFIERLMSMKDRAPKPAVRLLVNEELTREDVRTIVETRDLSKLEIHLKKQLKKPKDALEKDRLAMLAWLAKNRYVEIKVGIMRQGEGIVHAKFGIMTDEQENSIVFAGSGNESAKGLISNYERLEVSTSWEDQERHTEYKKEFEELWNDIHPDVHTVTLPEAIKLDLIKYAPDEPPAMEPRVATLRHKAGMIWKYLLTSSYSPNGHTVCDATALVELWPHQKKVVEETANTWPAGRLLCDEVGMGKTIEAIAILRRLLAGRGVRRTLILLPAGLLKQWQAELREKGGLIFPRLEGTSHLFWPDDSSKRLKNLEEAFKQDKLLMSRETARLENNLGLLLKAKPWDLVVLDETHAARRKKQEEGEYNSGTLLLDLLRLFQLRGRTRSFLLLSATPMQTHPWEPWDLLAVLGEGGKWLAEFSGIRDYYHGIHAIKKGLCDLDISNKIAKMITLDPDFPKPPEYLSDIHNQEKLSNDLWFASSSNPNEIADWLLKGSPLTKRMHRNTRETIRKYYQLGLLDNLPPKREVKDIVFDFKTKDERIIYDDIKNYIDTRFEELEKERTGKGFVMTVYRRRAASSPLALERSLQRRKDGLVRVTKRRAYESELSFCDTPEALDIEDLPEGEKTSKVSLAFPQDPRIAYSELREVNRLLEKIQSIQGQDTKLDYFFDILRQITEDGRAVLVFTEYIDTMEYLRNLLMPIFGATIACFSGRGGETWVNNNWTLVTKDKITEMLNDKKIHVLICTDAASEGLNLQAAGAVINYDLPWNPSRVEQRIGRIDRIGQVQHTVFVVNIFLKDSIDERVYKALQKRCGLFEHFVGQMQPVLAKARRMLLGRDKEDLEELENIAKCVEQEPVNSASYVENEAEYCTENVPLVNKLDLITSLNYLVDDLGIKTKYDSNLFEIQLPGRKKLKFGLTTESLENNAKILAFSLLSEELELIPNTLLRTGERLPLVIGTYKAESYCRSIPLWIGTKKTVKINGFNDLKRRLDEWKGDYPEPSRWIKARKRAEQEAKKQVYRMKKHSDVIYKKGLQRQIEAARIRLQKELGRYLVCLSGITASINTTLKNQMARDIASARRLKRCIDKLGGYPNWDSRWVGELDAFFQDLTEEKRKARLLGSEIDAALDDPRWIALEII